MQIAFGLFGILFLWLPLEVWRERKCMGLGFDLFLPFCPSLLCFWVAVLPLIV